MFERRTKIVATLGPATDPDGVLEALVAAGVDCARVNCSHGTHEDLRRRAAAVRAIDDRTGRALGLLFDIQGPKLRLASDTTARVVAAGERITFCRPQDAGGRAGRRRLRQVRRPSSPNGPRSSSATGCPASRVDEIDEGDVVVHAVSPGPLSPRKGINVTYARPELPAITDKDVADLEVAAEVGADFVALSFVRSAADLQELRERLEALGSKAKLVAKIEKIEAYEHLDEILAVTDGVMVARGDYGVEAGVARVPLMQKDTIQRATQAGKFVITATQMLESMIHAPEPTRAEAADIANAVIDGTSAVMLSAETSVGEYPLETVRAMAEIAKAAEESPVIHGRARDVAGREHRGGGHARGGRARATSSASWRWSSPRPPAGQRGYAPSTGASSRSSRCRTCPGWPTSSAWNGASTRRTCRPPRTSTT